MKTTKQFILAVIAAPFLVLAFSVSSFAKTSTNDFNSLIEENDQAQRQLAKDLQKQLNTQALAKHQQPNFNKVGIEVLGKSTSENVAVGSNSTHAPVAKHQDLEKKSFHRLSQELQDVK